MLAENDAAAAAAVAEMLLSLLDHTRPVGDKPSTVDWTKVDIMLSSFCFLVLLFVMQTWSVVKGHFRHQQDPGKYKNNLVEHTVSLSGPITFNSNAYSFFIMF